jgi:hypothetical protein
MYLSYIAVAAATAGASIVIACGVVLELNVKLEGASILLNRTEWVAGVLSETASCLLVLNTAFEALSWRGRLILRLFAVLLGTS